LFFSPLVWLLGSSSQKRSPLKALGSVRVPVCCVGWCRCIYLW